MRAQRLGAPVNSFPQSIGNGTSLQSLRRGAWRPAQQLPPSAAAPGPPPAMRRRAGELLRQAAGLATGGRLAAGAAGIAGSPGASRRLEPLASALHEGSSSIPAAASNGAASYGSAAGAGRPPAPAPAAASQASAVGTGLTDAQLEAAVAAAAPAAWGPRQRALLRDVLAAKLRGLQAHLVQTGQRLWALGSTPVQLAALGISAEELQSGVLVKHGTGGEALQALAAMVAAKQAAVLEGGEAQWAHLQEQRRLRSPPPEAPVVAAAHQVQPQAAQAGAAPPASQQRPQEGGAYVPPWRAQQRSADAAAAAAQQGPAGQGPEVPLERTPPSSSQVAGNAGQPPPVATSFAERRAQWQQGWQQQGWQGRQQQEQQGRPPSQQQQQQNQPVVPLRASIRDLLNERKIRLPAYSPGQYNHLLCPECLGGDKGEKSLSVMIEEGSETATWNCFRAKCGWTGGVNTKQGTSKAYRQFTNDSGFAVTALRKRKEEAPLRPNPSFDAALSPEVVAFFTSRGIGAATLERNRVAQETLADGSTAIAFPYLRDGQLVNIKYRATAEKKFWQVKGAEKVLYGLDDVVGAADIVVVEGEMDKLALEEAGVRNVVSVPDGAPARVREGEVPPADQDTKFSYLWNCRAWLDAASRVIIATDNDAPGDALAEELARRLGRERCWRVRWPLNEEDHQYAAELAGVDYVRHDEPAEAQGAGGPAAETALDADAAAALAALPDGSDGNGAAPAEQAVDQPPPQQQQQASASEALQLAVQAVYYRKDANEVLMKDGPAMLRAFMDSAEPFPIRGLLRFHEYYDDIMKYYRLEHKDGQGHSTGWPALDAYYKVVPGELTIVTGVPNSGKSEWIDALLANLAEQHDWCFALCSMEKKATDHARQLVEKYIGKPFYDLPYARGVRRMSERELDEGLDWIDDRFHLVRYEDDALPAVDWVLDVARAAVYRYGIRGLVIDPYNELDHQRPSAMSETEYVSQMLTKVKRFAQTTGVHVWFVAHPRQLREWKGQAPNLYDISGSAHFINKADNGIVVHRDRDPESTDQHRVQILVRKVRNKAAGTIGDCALEYERINGRYIDPDHPTGGPRTAQRLDFADLHRQERLAELRQQEKEATLDAAVQAELADAALAAAAASGSAVAPRQPIAAAPQAAAAAAVAAAASVVAEQRVAAGSAAAAAALEPVLAMRMDGTVSNDPVTDEQEVAAWLEGTS